MPRLPRLLAPCILVCLSGCASTRAPAVGQHRARSGEEIVVAGQFFHVGAPVVLWIDPDGYDAYRPWPHFGDPQPEAEQKARYGSRRLAPEGGEPGEEQRRRARNGQWSLEELRQVVDQFVIHYDACGTSQVCYRVLQDERNLSVHFLLDLDGTIYQTLDLDERAWHATIANDRSIGVELAQVGARPVERQGELDEWYAADGQGGTRVTLPARFGDGGLRTHGFAARSARPGPFQGTINGSQLVQYDFTPQQYESLARLAAALSRALPKIRLDYPRQADGSPLERAMSREEFQAHTGLIGHCHVQANKQDPGPAFDWERVVRTARALLDQG